ncbi:hypothetical protein A0H81_04778 [Grifola frondosa]|uniref:PhoD-like phosphatase domain-containing protein n=1 Tax=Grifola frondosa TaxID=5627 RepID=A0A1C7MG60_GRIFR|nr:hypothetical protein A0H81_04778 [Grifola frondosa]
MDNPGWHAGRQARKDDARWSTPHRGPDGKFQAVEQIGPMAEPFVGGFNLPPPHPSAGLDGRISVSTTASRTDTMSQLSNMSAIERSQALRVARMDPHLQFMAGPLLRYDTVDEQGIWHGAAMIVTADAGSMYDPHPILTYSWDPNVLIGNLKRTASRRRQETNSFDLGPHPADPLSNAMPGSDGEIHHHGPNEEWRYVQGQEIYVHYSNGGAFTFWRFMMEIPLGPNEMSITYSVNHGQELEFYVPARNQNMRWAAYSCNGFSAGVNPDDFRGPGFQSGFDPVWIDLLSHHAEQPFHALIGGGDQLYCDAIIREPELQGWVTQSKSDAKKNYRLTGEMRIAIDRFYFNHYCQIFRSGAFARANSSIPMLNMLDDHDLIDGFGSYPDDLMRSAVFGTIGSRGYFFFLLFQCFINVEIDGKDDRRHPFKSLIIGGDGPFVPFPSHSFLSWLGPHVYILLLDCRAERKKDQVCSQQEYKAVLTRVHALPSGVEHIVVLTGIPVAYPRLVFLESALDSKLNPLVALGRTGSLGLGGFVNKFNAEAELLDDLNDHWTAKGHKRERNWFIERLQQLAKAKHARISLISGDVHCAAVGVLKTLQKGKNRPDISPAMDYRYMLNIVSSAIVNTPPPNGVITMVSTLATKTHRTLHHLDTDESMIPIFETDTNGTAPKSKYIMGRRNWKKDMDKPLDTLFVLHLHSGLHEDIRDLKYPLEIFSRIPSPTSHDPNCDTYLNIYRSIWVDK